MIDYRTLSHLMKEAAEYGIKAALIDTGQIKAFISKAQAYKMYGAGTVQRWVREGVVSRYKDGSKASWRYDRKELELAARTNNVATYLSTQERNKN